MDLPKITKRWNHESDSFLLYVLPRPVSGLEEKLTPLMQVINRVVALFKLLIQNFPEHVTMRDNALNTFTYTINRFKVLGAITFILIVDRFRPATVTDRLNSVALVMSVAAGMS